jgi:hypothetical protein
MAIEFRPQESDYITREIDGCPTRLLSNTAFERFTTALRSLGGLNTRATPVNALAAIFDLEGFTKFCGRPDPGLTGKPPTSFWHGGLLAEAVAEPFARSGTARSAESKSRKRERFGVALP